MNMKKNIKSLKEQDTTIADLNKEKSILNVVFESHRNCIPSWLKNPTMSTHNDKPVIMGQNSKNEDIILYVDLKDPDKKLKAKNLITNKIGFWTCSAVDSITIKPSSEFTTDVNLPKEKCHSSLKNYLVNAIEYRARVQSSLAANFRQLQSDVIKCAGRGMYDKGNFQGFTKETLGLTVTKNLQPFGFFRGGNTLSWNEIKRILTGRNKLLGPDPKQSRPSSPYLISQNQFESIDKGIDKLISESLRQVITTKQKELIQENKIVKTRLRVLIEGKKTLSKIESTKLFKDIIEEVRHLNSMGIEKEVIKEELLGLLSTLTEPKNTSVMKSFKENFANWLSTKVVDRDSEVFMSDAVVSAIMSVEDNQAVNLIDCGFTSEILTKTVIEDWKNKLLVSSENPIYVSEILRKTLRDTIDNSTFYNTLKQRIEQMICPLLNKVEEKMKTSEKEIKNKLVST
jgi:hypothetical protein